MLAQYTFFPIIGLTRKLGELFLIIVGGSYMNSTRKYGLVVPSTGSELIKILITSYGQSIKSIALFAGVSTRTLYRLLGGAFKARETELRLFEFYCLCVLSL